jgi:hypothetical protein
MSFYIAIGAVLLWFVLVDVVKQLHQEAKERWEDRVMTDYLRAEDARYHRYQLEKIEEVRQATTDEMVRAAQDAGGGLVQGTAVEIEPR